MFFLQLKLQTTQLSPLLKIYFLFKI